MIGNKKRTIVDWLAEPKVEGYCLDSIAVKYFNQVNNLFYDLLLVYRKLRMVQAILISIRSEGKHNHDEFTAYSYLIRTVKRLTYSIHNQLGLYYHIKAALKCKPLDKEIRELLNDSNKKACERVERISTKLLPEYIKATPIGGYEIYLKENNSSLSEDLEKYFDNVYVLDDESKTERYNLYVKLILDVTKDMGYDYMPYLLHLAGLTEKQKEVRFKIQEQTKRDEIEERKIYTVHKFHSFCRKWNRAVETTNCDEIVGRNTYNSLISRALRANSSAYIVLVASFNTERSAGVTKVLSTDYKNLETSCLAKATIFIDSDEMNAAIDKWLSNNYAGEYYILQLN